MGDLNDEPTAATTQIIHGPGGSDLPVNDDGDVLEPIPANSGFARPDAGDGDRMWNLTALIPKTQRATRTYRGRGEVIDHIFASRALIGPDHLPHVHTHTVQALPSITDTATCRAGEPGSDHAAVTADLPLDGP